MDYDIRKYSEPINLTGPVRIGMPYMIIHNQKVEGGGEKQTVLIILKKWLICDASGFRGILSSN